MKDHHGRAAKYAGWLHPTETRIFLLHTSITDCSYPGLKPLAFFCSSLALEDPNRQLVLLR